MILLPDLYWELLLDAFRWPSEEVERVAYFDGIPTATGGVVTTLTLPDAQLAPLRYTVSSHAMSEAGQHFRADGLRRLAQVHTHPGSWVGHSPTDDEFAYAQHNGALSIVLPYHAQQRPRLEEAGVLQRDAHGWHELGPEEVSQTIRMIPTLLDFRRIA